MNKNNLDDLRKQYAEHLAKQIDALIEQWNVYKVSNAKYILDMLLFDLHKMIGTTGVYGYKEISHILREVEETMADEQCLSLNAERVSELLEEVKHLSQDTQKTVDIDDDLKDFDISKSDIIIIDTDKTNKKLIQERLEGSEVHLHFYDKFNNGLKDFSNTLENVLAIIANQNCLSEEDAYQIKMSAPAHQIEVILYTNKGDFSSRLKAVRNGATAYYNIPLNIEMLVEYVQTLIWNLSDSCARVMIVDDSQIFANFYQALFKKHDIEVEVVTQPSLVIDKLMSFKPDLVILDLYMPECNGIELAKIIKQHQGYANIPIVFFSSETDPETHAEAKEIGADDFLEKTIIPKNLIKNIKSRLKRSKQAHKLIETDSLTGLYVRRKLQSQLVNQISIYDRTGQTFTYVILDIDHFKEVNDTFGHGMGDGVLKHLATMLRNDLRHHDLIFRYGGEEFVVIMPNTKLDEGVKVIDRLRKQFNEMSYKVDDKVMTLSFSAGIAEFSKEYSIDALMNLADKCLYLAKNAGRNCIRTEKDLSQGDGDVKNK